jgi:hypothetical protein
MAGAAVLFHHSRRGGAGAALAWAGAAVFVFYPTPSTPAATLHWAGGRNGGVFVRTGERATLFDRGGGYRFLPPGLPVSRVRPFPEKDAGPLASPVEEAALDDWARDGRRWAEAGVRWEIRRPGDAKGFAARVEADGASALLAFGLTPGQQSALLRQGLPGADLLSWTSGGGGPPTDAFLAAVGPRWIVYPNSRVPRSARRAARGSGLFRPSGGGLAWAASKSPAAPRATERENL